MPLLDLASIPIFTELSRSVAEALGLAASVVLVQLQGDGDTAKAEIHGDAGISDAEIRRLAISEVDRSTFGDMQEATEKGGEALGVLVARQVFGRVVFRRLPKGTGADYLMRDAGLPLEDTYERLECSGIGTGQESATSRLRAKLQQLAKYPGQGRAVVTDFGSHPVEIRHGRWPQ